VTPTDEQIRAHWLSRPVPFGNEGLTFDERCYFALKRNARARLGMQGDDEFSRFCERSAAQVARELAENHDPGDEDRS
jgi:hypothetical protein